MTYITTESFFEWTVLAEERWDRHHKEPRKAGQPVTHINDTGHRVKRKQVPSNWVTEGYVIESEGEQIDLFEIS